MGNKINFPSDNRMYFDPQVKAEMYGNFLRGLRDYPKLRWLIILFSLVVFISPFVLFLINLGFVFVDPNKNAGDLFKAFSFVLGSSLFAFVGFKIILRK